MPSVVLAPATRADAAELIRGNLDSREHHQPWMAPFTDKAGFEAWFARTLCGPNIGLVAREVVSGQVVGVVNLSEIIAGMFQSAYLAYYGMVALAGRGLMTEGVQLATAHAFDVLGLHRLEANIQPGNSCSIALVRRLGFRLEGFSPRYLRIADEWRDHERWALLADETHPVRGTTCLLPP